MSVDIEAQKGEVVAVPFMCGETGLPFRAIFKRGHPRFRLSSVERLSPFLSEPQQECEDALEMDIGLLDTGSVECPWCQARGSIWRCGMCQTLSCASCVSTANNMRKKFQCQSCGHESDVTSGSGGTISKITVGDNPVTGLVGGNAVRLLTYQGS